MKNRIRSVLKNIFLLCLAMGLIFLFPLGVLAEDGQEDTETTTEEGAEEEYVNPFLEENIELYEEAMAMRGHILPGLAYVDDAEGEDQSRHYAPLMDGFVLGPSGVLTRYSGGNELEMTGRYEDENNSSWGLRYFLNNYSLRGNFELADYATIEDTPAAVRTTWTELRNFGFEMTSGKLLANWAHRETNRSWEYTGLNEYNSDRIALSYGIPCTNGNYDLGMVFSRIDSDDLGFNQRGTFAVKTNGRFDIADRTRMRLGYGGVWAQKPNSEAGGSFSKHTLSGSVTRRNCTVIKSDITVFGNFETLTGEQTLNSHWDSKYNFGAKVSHDCGCKCRLEAGALADYFSVDHLRYEMSGLKELMMRPGLTSDDLAPFMVRNYGHSYSGFFKGKMRFNKGGSFTQDIRLTRHHDNQAPDGAEETEIPAQQPLTLYDTWEWKTGIYAPLSDDVFWHLSNVFRKWDMRLRESGGQQNTFTTSLTWSSDKDSGFSVYYQNLMHEFSREEIDPYATDQHGLGFDGWCKTGDDVSFNGGLFVGQGKGDIHDFDKLKIFGSLTFGPEGKWKVMMEYLNSDNDDFANLDYDTFNAIVYYKIDL